MRFKVETVGVDGDVLFTDTVLFHWRAERRARQIEEDAFSSPLRLARIAITGDTGTPLPWMARVVPA